MLSQVFRKTVRTLSLLIATGFGCGLSPIAPGTVGSLVAVVLYYFSPLDASLLWNPRGPDLLVFLLILAVSFFVGVWVAHGISSPSDPDPRGFVWDEFVGMWVTCLLPDKHVIILAMAFVAFRFFDVVKPFPIRRLERLPGGLGIMADDLLAGIYGAVLCNLSLFVLFVSSRI